MIREINLIILFFALVTSAPSYDDITMGELPPDIAEQLEMMIKTVILDLKPNCTVIQTPDVRFLLYTRKNPDNPTTLEPSNPQGIDVRRKTVLILHGWLMSSTSSAITKLKDEYLKRYDCNVILIDWSQAAWQLYTVSYCDVPRVAQSVSSFLCVLAEKLNLRLELVHLIGHTMGGQIAGYVGQYVNTKCSQKLGRITGLDPSGPLFQYKPINERLDETDAEFVDVIHTDSLKFGHGRNCGDVDFHPNCALHQPGCPSNSRINSSTLVSDALCTPHRSLDYMVESVNSADFIGVSCSLCSRYCHPDIINEVYTAMGENCRTIPKPGYNFMLPTNSSSPYAKGWDPYPDRLSRSFLCRNATESRHPFMKKVCNVH